MTRVERETRRRRAHLRRIRASCEPPKSALPVTASRVDRVFRANHDDLTCKAHEREREREEKKLISRDARAENTRVHSNRFCQPVHVLNAVESRLTCRPALAERETAFAFALPESLPALPPACSDTKITVNLRDAAAKLRQSTGKTRRRARISTAVADGRRARQKHADTHHCATWIFGTHTARKTREQSRTTPSKRDEPAKCAWRY